MSRVSAITGLRIEVDAPRYVGQYAKAMEERARRLEEWAREFESFVRDHRSQDPVSLEVIRDREDQCSHCGSRWTETSDTYNGGCCAKDQVPEDERLAAIVATELAKAQP